jgi:hypothetical protein
MVGCGDDDDAGSAADAPADGTLAGSDTLADDDGPDDADDTGEATDDDGGADDDDASAGDDGDDDSDLSNLPFCDAVAALEVSFEEDEPALTAALEADTPAGLEDAVVVVREYTDRRQAGEDVFQDPDFLLVYNGAVGDLREHCGLG